METPPECWVALTPLAVIFAEVGASGMIVIGVAANTLVTSPFAAV
ncbi:hypothetical protein [Jatrophihabitans cynanchi]|nr:hypothetical protein [Jatrophihabitans sp. SB3-54]